MDGRIEIGDLGNTQEMGWDSEGCNACLAENLSMEKVVIGLAWVVNVAHFVYRWPRPHLGIPRLLADYYK